MSRSFLPNPALPLFPLQTVLCPDGLLELKIFETRYLDLMARWPLERHWFGWLTLSLQRSTRQATFSVYDERGRRVSDERGQIPYAFDQTLVANAVLSYRFDAGSGAEELGKNFQATLDAIAHVDSLVGARRPECLCRLAPR